MKMYKILDTKMNREFKPELIGYSFEGVESGEYVILTVNGTNVTILSEGIEVLEGENLMNKERLCPLCKYEVVAETNKGYRILVGTEYIKNIFNEYTKRIMHVLIYDFNTKEVIYSTGNNLRLTYEEYKTYLQCELSQWIDENIEDSYNFKYTLDNILYLRKNYDIVKMIRKDQIMRIVETLEAEKLNKLNEENIELKTELYKIAEERNVFVLEYLGNIALLSFKDIKQAKEHFKNNSKWLYDLITERDKKEDLQKYIDNNDLYIYDIYYVYGAKDLNNCLKFAIDYITNNINIPVNKDSDIKINKQIINKIKCNVIQYFIKDKNICDENIIDSEIDTIIDISKQIRSKLQYKNGVYYPVNELFQDIQLSDDYYKYFLMDALKVQDIEFYNSNELYRVCS
jgi:hypothetical protein